jgi:hypothetical protein
VKDLLLNLAAVDPGGRTGLACACIAPGRLLPHDAVREAIVQRRGMVLQVEGDFNEQVVEIKEHLDERVLKSGYGRQRAYEVRNVLAIEGFSLWDAHMRDSALFPVRIAAKLEFYLWLEDSPWEIVWQQPSDMRTVSDNALRSWAMWMKGKGKKDARAALKHLIVLARKLDQEPY